ncbi:hypothetical protein BO85DRAFT_465457 [Aspergillus piperis CBS 112811]|uniref:AB hydrolase-1 domain-containing protein n=1 Tax=Aspergillus piperis CBS 112811 TaxID=1448313 RepID=A0A8G1VT67_9EURO|nr:hypothetical protein BO85DRAFT_465457 [Aspergillus piperis CBS 112811]RAH63680.1 hypothetical protein BO85DRAFT_465457 [Aspergillus piperis CBS 112811]
MSSPFPCLSGTHFGHITIDGPVIIIEAGLGSSHSEWVVVQRLIAEHARNRAYELSRILEVAGIKPPYVLVGQSYGGVLIREFRMHTKSKLAGMVIVDAWRQPNPSQRGWFNLLGEVVIVVVVRLDINHVFCAEKYERIKEDKKRNENMFRMEEGFVANSMEEVTAGLPLGFQALGDERLSVVFGILSVRTNLPARLETIERVDEEIQRAHLGLLSQSRFVYAQGKVMTHNVHYMAPELIRDELLWVLRLMYRHSDGWDCLLIRKRK